MSENVKSEKKIKLIIGNSGIKCNRCKMLESNIKKAIEEFKNEGIEFSIETLNVTRPEVIEKFGPLATPVLFFDDTVVSTGSIPNAKRISSALKMYLDKM